MARILVIVMKCKFLPVEILVYEYTTCATLSMYKNFPILSLCFISLFSSIVNVSIVVEDVNDNSPEFINEPYRAVIIEVCMIIIINKP